MSINTTAIVATVGGSTSFINILIGSGILSIIFTLIIRYFDNKNKKKATLYYPLYLACNGIVEVITNHSKLHEYQGKMLLMASAKTLDEIIFNYGSIVYLDSTSLKELLQMKSSIDEKLKSVSEYNWDLLESKFEDDDFQNIAKKAKSLISLCKKKVKKLKKLSE